MSNENQAVSFKIDDGKLNLTVDPNKDGQPLVTLSIDLKEVPDEVVDAFTSMKKSDA